MKYVLYIMLTVLLESGEPLKQEFTLSFDDNKKCTEFKKVVDVGLAFFRLAEEELNFVAYIDGCKKVDTFEKKGI